MKRVFAGLLCLTMGLPPLWSADAPTLRGYSTASSRTELEWEAKFRALPDTAQMRAYMQRLAARPHHVGSAYDKDNAEWIAAKAKEWGLDPKIETFDVLFPTPKERLLEIVAPTHIAAKIAEPPLAVDPTSQLQSEQLPTYNAYSIDGDVTGPVVYVNYGVPADYDELERQGVSVKGAIVLARYGGSWRGIKPKVAAEHGAIGCLIYSDPADDGYVAGDVFPEGPMRPSNGAQRGSVMDMPVYPGDPLTPGVGATKDAKRLALKDVTTLTKIPVMPISYGDAQPMLASLKGPLAPTGWRGGLPLTYHLGPGGTRVHLKLAFNWDLKTLYDVIVRIPGSTNPDEWVIRGNHHDAWVNGAQDPVSGASPMMEELRALGALLKQGWQPKRTIIYCWWDGEEPGLLGSTEWAETHEDELRQKAVVYLNSDGNGRGMLQVEGSHTLEKFINGVAKEVEDPEARISVWRRLQASRLSNTAAPDHNEARTRADLRIAALGSGSDYSAFLDHLGVPSVNVGFGGEDPGGIYHSIYDDFYWFTHFSDGDFVYGRALAQLAGTSVIRMADAELLPFEFGNFTETVRRYIDEVERLAKDTRDRTIETNKLIEEGVFAAVKDPRLPRTPPKTEPVPPVLNFAPLENAFTELQKVAASYEQTAAEVSGMDSGAMLARASLRDVNAKLIAVERALTLKEGLPNRPWFRHQIYAPGFYTGYGVKTLPAVRESIEQKDWKLADEEIVKVGKVLENAGEAIGGAKLELARSAR